MEKPLVLIADDDPDIREDLVSCLKKRNLRVIEAKNGKEAVDLGCEHKPVLAILDFKMPGMSGLEAAVQLKTEAGVPSFFLSGFDDEEIVRKATEGGALGYIVKPLHIEEILPFIEIALQRAVEMDQPDDEQDTGNQSDYRLSHEISVATGILMEQQHLTEQEAYDSLCEKARTQQRNIGSVASDMVKALDLYNSYTAKLRDSKPSTQAEYK